MSNDKPLCVYALFLKFSTRRRRIARRRHRTILPQQAMSNDKPLCVYALFLRFSVRRRRIARRRHRTLFYNGRCLTTSRFASTLYF
ncbi:MAG: hypothetical protein ACYTXC_13245 [Nostoc sp.]